MSNETPNPSITKTPEQEQYDRIKYNIALGAIIICPLIILLPPRKLDFYTVSLGGAAILGANHLANERSRILSQIPVPSSSQEFISDKTRDVQMKLRDIKDAMDTESVGLKDRFGNNGKGVQESVTSAVSGLRWETAAGAEERIKAEEAKRKAEAEMGISGDSEKPDWKVERDRREREYLEDGKSYGDLIMDQIWEVWNWGQAKTEEIKEVDEKVVEARKEKRK